MMYSIEFQLQIIFWVLYTSRTPIKVVIDGAIRIGPAIRIKLRQARRKPRDHHSFPLLRGPFHHPISPPGLNS